MKRNLNILLYVACGLFIANKSFAQQSKATIAPTGIEIVQKLEKPKSATKFNEKDLAGYLLVYFKDKDQSAYMAISSDGYTFTDINGGQPVFIGGSTG